ncbi:MAG TPA: ATP-binding cassette domain-containing protein [Bacilli bacterium]|nr:MAG: ABC transporter ATP-binding protein YtrB [Tenericutes bacterium ADurb.BinA124]HNZ49946.1 ATP-binding cassette domain-containing protein [Bacilli bacterium]HPN61166.1 ATP-binding cassette domain-containing protein [Bacilli bacterium]HPX83719.1 ATP-binding cassette domain-containing protein [Bacilli bacterium]HQC74579.1 ATP-binding cassette domain-containing protein [Bacilli bacterium]
MSVLVCENVTKLYRKHPSVINFNYNFLDNQIYAIIGKSDSGKETLLNLISTKAKPNEGQVFLDGQLLYNNPLMAKRICFISKKMSFPGHLSIREICQLMASFYPKWDNGYAYELMHFFEIKPNTLYYKLFPNKKELLLGILGLASRANITVFENPLDDVDAKDRYDFFNFVYSHHTRYPRTLILSTDYIDEIESIVHKVLFFDKGRLFENFTTEEIKTSFKYLSGKTEVLKSLITGIKVIGVEERDNNLTVCIRKKLTKDEIRKYQKYLIKISEVPIQKVFIYLINLREMKGI